MRRTFPKTFLYCGKELTLKGIARRERCDVKVVYRYLVKHGNLDGFRERHLAWPPRIPFKGKRLTAQEIARLTETSDDSVRTYYRRHKTMEGYGNFRPTKGKPIPHLERYYNTLDDSIPLDRCLKAAGYRSLRQFCEVNNVSPTLLGCWRRGKTCDPNGYGRRVSNYTLADEMTNFKSGLSTAMWKLIDATGFLEFELFPDVFNDGFYGELYHDAARAGAIPTASNPDFERIECDGSVAAVLDTLTERERIAIELRYGLGKDGRQHSLGEIGRYFRLTRERARQVIERAIRRLRHPSRSKCLLEVLPFRCPADWEGDDAGE